MKKMHSTLIIALLISVFFSSLIFITVFAQVIPLSTRFYPQTEFFIGVNTIMGTDPIYANSEISIDPYPVLAGQPSEVCVKLRNQSPSPQDVAVTFSWAGFGIGLPFTAIGEPLPVLLPPYSVVNRCIMWVPPISGKVDLQVMLVEEGYEPQYSQRNMDTSEVLQAGVPGVLYFPVGNPLGETVTISLGLIPYLAGWTIQVSPDVLLNMAPGEVRYVTLTVTPPVGPPLPADNTPVVDVEAYANAALISGIELLFRSEQMNYLFLPLVKK